MIKKHRKAILIVLASGILIAIGCHPDVPMPMGGKMRNHQPDMDQLSQPTYNIQLDDETCKVDIEAALGINSLYEEKELINKNIRQITINSIPSHKVGAFPNQGNPNEIDERNKTCNLPLNPQIAKRKTMGMGFETAVLFSGATIDPFTAEFFVGSTGKTNRNWNITTLTSTANMGLDCNNGHVQPSGKYHYHGVPNAYLTQFNITQPRMIKVGYASDGFPIYYKYGYNESGDLQAYQSGYQLKKGKRPGDGKSAPDGYYNGRYFKDYEYINGLSDLDECNGRWGKTPESKHEYYYIITDNFPSVPLCFSGTPSDEMRVGPGGGRGRPPHRHHHGDGHHHSHHFGG